MTTRRQGLKERKSAQDLNELAAEIERTPSPVGKKKSKSAKSGKKDNTAVKQVTRAQNYDIFNLPSSDWTVLMIITAIATVIRLFRIHQPTSVVFDEVHFGGFATKYIKGKFFMDVHPPLAKLLITLAGWLAGFDGSFDFKEIGKDYIAPKVPYVAMRMLPAIMGIMLVPTTFLTLKASGCSTIAAGLGASFITFENGLVTQSRLILLDSPLVIFTALTAMSWVSFMNQHAQGPTAWFSPNWWFWLTATGLGLGTTASVKWVGLFTIGWVGAITVLQLWLLLGDTENVPVRKFARHVAARALCLIVLPIAFYMAMFYIHFLCLKNPGEGDGFMSAEFQSTLNTKQMAAVPADVALGSRVSIRHWNTQGGYLHSHNHMYPAGSKQQQVTLYPHRDENNLWIVENMTAPEVPEGTPDKDAGKKYLAFDSISPVINVKDGDTIKLYHTPTHRRLHSHDVRGPVTEADWQNEVSAYGYEGFDGDANDYFRVEIIKGMSTGSLAKERLRTIDTKFKLVHVMTGCVLFSHKVKLPKWGFEQQEVTCARSATLPNSVWYVEQNEHPLMKGDDVETVTYRKPGFLAKFWELNKVMWKTNAGLTDSHVYDSRPQAWPVLKRGINFWGKPQRQIYLMGNPVIWFSSTIAIVAYVLFKGIATLRWQRGFNDYTIENFRRYDFEVGASVLGWAFHFLPFFLMKRQLFLHHYFPALFFAILALCQAWDFIFVRLKVLGLQNKQSIALGATTVYLVISIIAFYLYSPLAYGNMWTKNECKRVQLFDKWDWDCSRFPDNYASYSNEALGSDAMQTAEAGAADNGNAKPAGGAPVPPEQPAVSPKPDPRQIPSEIPPLQQDEHIPGSIIKREEKVEYRDQFGNLLDEAQVQELQGKVEFKTKYETRTRLVDADGNEIPHSEMPEMQQDGGDEMQEVPEGEEVGDEVQYEQVEGDYEDHEEVIPTGEDYAEAMEPGTAAAEATDNLSEPSSAPVAEEDINTKSRRHEEPLAAEPESGVEIETNSVADQAPVEGNVQASAESIVDAAKENIENIKEKVEEAAQSVVGN